MPSPASTLAALRALCRQGLGADTLVPAMLEGLHAVVPSQRNLFDFTDPQGALLRYVIEGPIDLALAQLYFDEFHNQREAEAMAPFEALRLQPAGVRGPHDLHAGFYRSALYQAIWRPQGFYSRIEGVVRSRSGLLLGSLVLYRGPNDPTFSADEMQRLQALLPALAQALQEDAGSHGSSNSGRPDVPAPEPAETLLLTLDGQVCHASAGAWRWLLMADGGASPLAVAQLARDLQQRRLDLAGRSRLLARLLAPLQAWQARACPGRPPPSSTQQAGAGGCFHATAQWLQPVSGGAAAALVMVQLRRHEPHRVALERALRGLPITAGQAAVCRAVYQGLPQPEIAQHLGVAATTVIDHLRKAYRSLDLHSAQALRNMLDSRIAQAAAAA